MHAYRQSPFPLLSVDTCLQKILELTNPHEPVTAALKDAFGCILSEDVYCEESFPPFPASIMDGYAVIAEDCPNDLEVIGIISASGNISDIIVSSGYCAQITTGSPIPKGANAVIKVEDTEVVSKRDDGTEYFVKIKVPVFVGQCIRPVGSDISLGQLVVSKGDKIGSTEIGLLSSLGISNVSIYPSPTIAVLSTGNELVESNESPIAGQIRDSNRPMLISSLLQENVKNIIDMGIAIDDKVILEEKILSTLKNSDILISSGGVSMGELDLLKIILEKIGTIHFGRVLMKPGKPCTFATCVVDGKEKLIFGLPGNPVSSLACFYLFCVPCIRKIFGLKDCNLLKIQAKLTHDCKLDPERPEYLRSSIRWSGTEFLAVSTGTQQQSSRLLSFKSANALLMLPQQPGILSTGTVVDALLIGPLQ